MANLWLAVVLLCLTMYVILDGYDLGIGTVMLLERRRDRQREMVEVVATTWDGNETWLILLGVALWGGLSAGVRSRAPARVPATDNDAPRAHCAGCEH